MLSHLAYRLTRVLLQYTAGGGFLGPAHDAPEVYKSLPIRLVPEVFSRFRLTSGTVIVHAVGYDSQQRQRNRTVNAQER